MNSSRPESLLDDPDHWRRQAQQIRNLAEGVAGERRENLLQIARDYDKLVLKAERRVADGEGGR